MSMSINVPPVLYITDRGAFENLQSLYTCHTQEVTSVLVKCGYFDKLVEAQVLNGEPVLHRCQRRAPYSHVLDVVNFGLNVCKEAVHLLL